MAYSKTNTINVAFAGTSVSQDLSSQAKQITLSSDAGCYISFDSTIVSSDNGYYIPADTQYTFDVLYPAQIAVIQDSGAGTISVMELGDAAGIGAMAVTYQDTFSGDTNLIGEVVADFSGDSNLKIESISSTFTGDCNLGATYGTSFTGDCNLAAVYGSTYTGDSSLKIEVVSAFTGDANLKAADIHPNVFQSDALLVTF